MNPAMSDRRLVEHLLAIYPNLKCLFMSEHTVALNANHGILEDGVTFIQKLFSAQGLAKSILEAQGT